MKRNPVMLFIVLLAFQFLASFAVTGSAEPGDRAGTPAPSPEGWRLVWSDEFDAEGHPDPTRWGYEEGFIRNREKQFYTRARKENARAENGMLVIEARREDYKGARYTSASLNTQGRMERIGGRFEIRAKLPTGRGTWPAIWMLGANMKEVGWPACGEIDIMENVGFEPDVIHANIHTSAYNHVKRTQKGNRIHVQKPYESFHVYAVEWRPDRLDFFVDGRKYFTFEKEDGGRDVWPFDQPHYLLLNLAIGGEWGGQKGIDDTIFPQRYYIDYVRIYEPVE